MLTSIVRRARSIFRRKTLRGVSPIIGTALLIAITIPLAAVLAFNVGELTNKLTTNANYIDVMAPTACYFTVGTTKYIYVDMRLSNYAGSPITVTISIKDLSQTLTSFSGYLGTTTEVPATAAPIEKTAIFTTTGTVADGDKLLITITYTPPGSSLKYNVTKVVTLHTCTT